MSYIKYIKNKKKILAVVIKKQKKLKNKINFITDNKKEMQLALMDRPAKEKILPHYHPKQKRLVRNTSEFLYVISGKVKINFYQPKLKLKYITSEILNSGDSLCFFDCGHSFEFIKKTKLIEVKQGPFINNKDKKKLKI